MASPCAQARRGYALWRTGTFGVPSARKILMVRPDTTARAHGVALIGYILIRRNAASMKPGVTNESRGAAGENSEVQLTRQCNHTTAPFTALQRTFSR
jgi:hypothetical protein